MQSTHTRAAQIRAALVRTVMLSIVTSQISGAQSPALTLAPAPDWSLVADALVARMQLTKGERVLLVAQPGVADGLVAPLRAAIAKAGGLDLGALAVRGDAPSGWSTDFTRGATGKSEDQLILYLGKVDVGVMMPGATVTDAAYGAMQRMLRAPNAGIARTMHVHWSGAYALNGDPISITKPFARLYQRAVVSTNYASLALRQQEFEQAMRGASERGASVHVTTPAGTDLTFTIGNRPVTRQDGDASAARMRRAKNLIDREVEVPAGAIRVAPIETSVRGAIAFPDGVWGGVRVTGLVMRFERGVLTDFTARSGRDGVDKELAAAGVSGRSFREFVLGFNPLLAIPERGEKWIPYYGYGAGVVRLSLGDNTELGGTVGGGYVRWNFFTDATVTVGNDVWVRAGKMKE